LPFFDDLLAGGWRDTLGMQLREFEIFISGMDSLLANAAQSEKQWLTEQTAGMDEESKGEFVAWQSEAYQKFNEDFPTLLWNSLTVMIFAHWEKEYRQVAEWLLKSFNKRRGITHTSALTVGDFNGAWYEQARKAITQYAGIPDDEALWARLVCFARIRNVIAHNGGLVDMQEVNGGEMIVRDRRLESIIEQFKKHGLHVTQYHELAASRKFVEHELDVVRRYMNHLLRACEAHFAKPRTT
jgi:hypothetical protein